MKLILAIPWEMRVAGLFVLGAVVGSFINFFVDRLRWETPRHSPWNDVWERWRRKWFGSADSAAVSHGRQVSQPDSANTSRDRKRAKRGRRDRKRAKPRAVSPWLDRLPLVGWLALSRLSPQKGARFWVRPLLVELLCGLVFAGLYAWEVGALRMIPDLDARLARLPALPLPIAAALHWQYLVHVLLFSLMVAASLIDLDEWVIPDAITVPGTLAALVLAVVAPASRLSNLPLLLPDGMKGLAALHFASPSIALPNALHSGQTGGLALALCCVWLWCFAELPRTWRTRRGWVFAVRLFLLRLARERWTSWVLLIGLALTAVVVPVWWSGGSRWTALLSALVGMAVGGGMIWLVRIVCSAVLRKEAMGFGDVTLMAMIGAFLGWQVCVLVFFFSPVFALLPPLASLLMRSKVQPALPYGPFLCSAAAAVLFCWARLWPWTADVIDVVALVLGPWFFALFAAGALVLMAALLALWQLVKRALGWA